MLKRNLLAAAAGAFLFVSCKQPQERAPSEQTSRAPDQSLPAQPSLSIDLPELPASGPSQTPESAGGLKNNTLYSWDLKKITTPADLGKNIQKCAKDFSAQSNITNPSLLAWLTALRTCEAANSASFSACEDLRSLSSRENDAVQYCKDRAFQARLSYSIALKDISSCEAALRMSPFSIKMPLSQACSLIFQAQKTKSEAPLLELAKSSGKMHAEELFWVMGAETCSQKVSGKGLGPEECLKFGSISQLEKALQSKNNVSCGKNALCLKAFELSERPACESPRLALAEASCFYNLRAAFAGQNLTEAFLKELDRLHKTFRTPE